MNAPLFHRYTAAILMSIGALAFISVIAIRELAPEIRTMNTAGADGYSRSAIGYGALVETLERVGYPVRQSRFRPVRSSRPGDLIVAAMPPRPESLNDLVDRWLSEPDGARSLMLILPKWLGRRDAGNPRWLSATWTVPARHTVAVLRAVSPLLTEPAGGANVTRMSVPPAWRPGSLGGIPDIENPMLTNDLGMVPVLSSDRGDLISRQTRDGRTLWLVSDPDLIDNFGLGQGDNAAIVLDLFAAAVPGGGAVVFDETLHGFVLPPSLWRMLLQPRFLPAVLAGLLSVMALSWMASARFGAPRPRRTRYRDGKRALIDSSAVLLSRGRHHGPVLAAYAAAARRMVENQGRTAHPARSREIDARGEALLAEAEALRNNRWSGGRATRKLARDIHLWKRETVNGSGRG